MILEKETEFAATYYFGKTTVHIKAPIDVSEVQKQKILEEVHTIGWKILRDENKRNVEKTNN